MENGNLRYRYVFWNDGENWRPYNQVPVTDDKSIRQLLAGLKVSKNSSLKECRIINTKEPIILPSKIDSGFFESVKEGGGLLEIPLL